MIGAAQALWAQRPLQARLALLARWQARQDLRLRAGLGLLQEQAPAADQQRVSTLADGRRQLDGWGPLGVVELGADPGEASALARAVHMAWACALGNAVVLPAADGVLASAAEALQQLLQEADPALAPLLCTGAPDGEPVLHRRRVDTAAAAVVVSPSAELTLLVPQARHAARLSGAALWVNHALHHEVGCRLPEAEPRADVTAAPPPGVGQLLLAACGEVQAQLTQLYQGGARRVSLYSSDFEEVQRAAELAQACGADLLVNDVEPPPLGLPEAQACYGRRCRVLLRRADA